MLIQLLYMGLVLIKKTCIRSKGQHDLLNLVKCQMRACEMYGNEISIAIFFFIPTPIKNDVMATIKNIYFEIL